MWPQLPHYIDHLQWIRGISQSLLGIFATCSHSWWTELWHPLTTQMTRNPTIATLSIDLKHPLRLPWRRIYIILPRWNNIHTAHWIREEKSLAIYWRGENLNRTIGFGVGMYARACFIHGTSEIQNRKSNWISASDLNHWPCDCPVCDFQSKIPSSAVTEWG